jgi:cytochrome c-type biogenesis protein CcmH
VALSIWSPVRDWLSVGAALLVVVGAVVAGPPIAHGQAGTSTQREAQEIARTLKCPVCESQSVADSPSQLAQEMRGYIERRLGAGESRDAIVQGLIDRYGEGILLEPPRQGFTLIVWWLPIISLVIGAAAVAFTLRRALRPASGGGDAPGATLGGATRPSALPSAASSQVGAELATDEMAHYRARLAEELARREGGQT